MTPDRLGRPSYSTVPELIATCAEHRPDVALLAESDGGDLTGSDLLERTVRGAHLLRERGVRHGEFVGIDTTSMRWTEVATTYSAITWLGAVAVLVMDAAAERGARDRLGVRRLVTAAPRRPQPDLDVTSPGELRAAPPAEAPPGARADDPLDVVYTSGTTGSPKPVISTHAQWVRAVRPEILASRTRRTVGHTGVPIAVSGGLHGVLLTHLARGVTSVCGETAADLLAACRARRTDELHVTPHAARTLVELMGPTEPWAPSVRIVRVVGGPVPATLAAGLAGRFPAARVVSFYGLTEGGAAQCVKVLGSGQRDSIGRPVAGTEIRVFDGEGREVPRGQVGELVVWTAGGALAYYREDALNQAWFHGGWARTGDVGFVAPDGEVRLVGRAKELLFLRGGRVSPEAIEDILARVIPPRVEFAVLGISSDAAWDQIAVFLAGTPESEEVASARRSLERMRGPFRPHVVRLVDEIPRGPFGKPLRRVLARVLSGDG
jgi:acyl-coenzyme A synthetase/AMP-(fatty) acid ligase